ncbi:uncharacterized protein LOC143013875 isoform X2 [Genypterus blacodes]|uniref:uncharacterized protein LOC143013875 isoform X2 n=1 Tax=Genypterus blacodes TaxID=154954 RepID=UPI003F75A2B2
MSKVQMLRAFVSQRLSSAVEEIFVLFERTITEYEDEVSRSKEENERQRKLLEAVWSPEVHLERADVQQLVQQEWLPYLDHKDPEPPHSEVQQLCPCQEEEQPEGVERSANQLTVKSEEVQQEWSSSVKQEDPQPPFMKEEHGEEQLQSPEEAGGTEGSPAPVPVKGEGEEEDACQSQTEQSRRRETPASSSTERMKARSEGEDCEGPEPARDSGPVSEDRDSTSWEKPFRCYVCEEGLLRPDLCPYEMGLCSWLVLVLHSPLHQVLLAPSHCSPQFGVDEVGRDELLLLHGCQSSHWQNQR